MRTVDECLRILGLLVESAGGSIEAVRSTLERNRADAQTRDDLAQRESLRDVAISGFFHCAARNVIFTDLSRVKGLYGRALGEVYPWASPTFMKLARTYWTFKVALRECGHDESVCAGLLWSIDETFAGVFFPTPGPIAPSREMRETTMRLVIEESGANFDVEDYMMNNPYLQE